MKSRISKFLDLLFWICFSLMILYIFSCRNKVDFPFFRLEVLIAIGAFFWCVTNTKQFNRFAIFIFAFGFLIRFVTIVVIKTEPQSDIQLMFNAAQMLMKGDFSYNEWWYFQNWEYQIGFVAWQALFLKIYDSIWMLKIINCIMGAGIGLLIYLIGKEIVKNEVASRFVSLLYAIFPFAVLHVTVLSNCHSSAFFLFLGLFFLIKNGLFRHDWFRYILSAFCMAIGNLLRPDGIIILVSIGSWFLFEIFKTDKNKIKKLIGKVVLLIGVYFCTIFLITNLLMVTGVSPKGLDNENPLWKFVVGTNYKSYGGWNQEDENNLVDGLEQGKTYEEISIPIIKERLSQTGKMLCLIDEKVNQLWWQDATWWSFSAEQRKEFPEIMDWIKEINIGIWSIVLLLSGLGIKYWYDISRDNKKNLLVAFIIFASFSVYLMIEVQPRYLYLPQIAVFIMAAGGIQESLIMLKKCKTIKKYRD